MSTLDLDGRQAVPGTLPATPVREGPGPDHRPTGRSRRRRPTGALLSRAAVNGLLAVAALYTLMPLAWLLIAATKDHGDLFGTGGFTLGAFHLFDNLRAVFTADGGIYGRWLLNSLLYSLVGSLVSTLICVAAGYAFDKYHFAGKDKLFGVVLAGILVPGTVISLPMYLLASEAGLVNTYWAVLIPSLVNPFGVYLARVFSEGYIPNEVLEAARMDGAGELKTFRTVSLPMLAPGFMTIFLFSFTGSWNSFYLPLMMLNDQHLYPVGLGIYNWNTVVVNNPEYYSLAITGALVAVLPLIAVFIGLQRFWRSGLTAGAVK
ncbi:carbohydrate ABC transporter permease [Streptomyces sp. So13.3]|uniref:carbohydrate ABC transporter permease n=1 Tax=Streptomyces fildesensis TaxID=375757 RepID=UPI0011057A84|nr:carbohydrate ABC transporter permease [Streptomyces sp. So13.3]